MGLFTRSAKMQWSCLIAEHTPNLFGEKDLPRLCPTCHNGLLPKDVVDALIEAKIENTPNPKNKENLLLLICMFYVAWAQYNLIQQTLTVEAEASEEIPSRDRYFGTLDFSKSWPGMMASWNYLGNQHIGNVLDNDQFKFAVFAMGANYLNWEVTNAEETRVKIYPFPYLAAITRKNFAAFEELYLKLTEIVMPLQVLTSLMPIFLDAIRSNLHNFGTYRAVTVKSTTEIAFQFSNSDVEDEYSNLDEDDEEPSSEDLERLLSVQPSAIKDQEEVPFFYRILHKDTGPQKLIGPFGSVQELEYDEQHKVLRVLTQSQFFVLDKDVGDLSVPYASIRVKLDRDVLPSGFKLTFADNTGLYDVPWWWTRQEMTTQSSIGRNPWLM